jgi:hypothetical protein
MQITKRICDVKRHTVGFNIDGKRVTRGCVVKMARSGKFKCVVAKHGPNGWYVSRKPNSGVRKLYQLPIKVEE